jgi:serine/threonine protein kinase
MLSEGSMIAGCRIETPIGRGGMGIVFRARQLALDRPVAVKVIATEFAREPAFRARFAREARSAASVDHPNAVPIYDAGEDEGHLYLVMRLVEGEDAAALVRNRGPFDAGHAVRLLTQVAGALDAAHAAGLVHRDVKPANVLVDAEGRAFLTDFGLAKIAGASGLTRTGEWLGTLAYVAPEQIRGGRVDARADIYALGCVLFHLLTGRPPFDRDSDAAILHGHLNDHVPALPARVRAAGALDRVLARALAKDPAERYASAGEFARAAATALSKGAVARRDDHVPAPTLVQPTHRTEILGHPPRARRGRLITAAVTLVVALGLGAAITLGSRDASDPSSRRLATASAPSPASTSAPAAPIVQLAAWPEERSAFTVVLASSPSRSVVRRVAVRARKVAGTPGGVAIGRLRQPPPRLLGGILRLVRVSWRRPVRGRAV